MYSIRDCILVLIYTGWSRIFLQCQAPDLGLADISDYSLFLNQTQGSSLIVTPNANAKSKACCGEIIIPRNKSKL